MRLKKLKALNRNMHSAKGTARFKRMSFKKQKRWSTRDKRVSFLWGKYKKMW